jgi:hypothetical protein
MPIGWIITLSLLYIVLSPVAVWFMQSRFNGSIPEKLITILSTPGCIILLFFIAAPLSIPYFRLYPERHATTIDFEGTEDEKAELTASRLALRQETLWSRIMYSTGRHPASENRVVAERKINQTWQRFNERTSCSTRAGNDDPGTEGEQAAS